MHRDRIKDGFYWCCEKKLQKVTSSTVFIGELYCRFCKTPHNVVIVNGRLMQENPAVS